MFPRFSPKSQVFSLDTRRTVIHKRKTLLLPSSSRIHKMMTRLALRRFSALPLRRLGDKRWFSSADDGFDATSSSSKAQPPSEAIDGFITFPKELPSNAQDPSKDDFINDATSPPRTREQQMEYNKHESLRDWLGRQSRKRSVDEIVVLTGNIHRGA